MLFNNVAKLFLVLGVLGVLSLFACSSGGGGGGDNKTPSSDDPPVEDTPGPTPNPGATGSYLFYSGSISAVDPAAPASPITVEAGTDITQSVESPVISGTWDAATQTLNNIHDHAIVYAKTNGRFYKVSAMKSSGTPTPVQLSSEAAFGAIPCQGVDVYSDYANPDNTQLIYRVPSGNCRTYKMMRLGMSATDAPVVAKEPVDPLHDQTTGALIGWLVDDAGALKRCDANFANCGASMKSISSSANSVTSLGLTKILLEIDNVLYVYDVNANTLATIYTGALNDLGQNVVSDGSKLYFSTDAAPKSIYVAPMDGSAPATVLLTDAAYIRGIRLSTDKSKLLYEVGIDPNTSSSTEFKAVAKTGGTATTLANGGILFTSGNHVYYVRIGSGAFTAGVIDDDGSNQSETANAMWSGYDIGTSFNFSGSESSGPNLQTIIRAEDYNLLGAGKGFAGGKLRAFNAASKTELGVLGTVPTDITS